MPTSPLTRRRAAAALGALMMAGCAATTPPPRFSPVSPADPAGPESGVPAARPILSGAEGDLAEPASNPSPKAGAVHGHGSDAPSPPLGEVYTCSMHPEVATPEPGRCPVCGMGLVKKAAKPESRQ